MRPLIGVTSLWDDVKSCGWMWQNYMELIWDAGGMPVVLPLNAAPEAVQEAVDRCDGFLFTGGRVILTVNIPNIVKNRQWRATRWNLSCLMRRDQCIDRSSVFVEDCS